MFQGDFSGSAKEGGIKHCVQLQDAGAINPVAYLNGLAKAVTDMGGTIYESTRVRKPDRSVLQTEAGNKVTIDHSTFLLVGCMWHASKRPWP